MPKHLLVAVLKKLQAGAFALGCLVRQTLFPLCPQTFSFVMALMLTLSTTVGILRLDPNLFQQLSEIFQT